MFDMSKKCPRNVQEMSKKCLSNQRQDDPFFSNAAGQDQRTNTGRKKKSLHAIQNIKFVVEAFGTMSKSDYISTLAHDRQKSDS